MWALLFTKWIHISGFFLIIGNRPAHYRNLNGGTRRFASVILRVLGGLILSWHFDIRSFGVLFEVCEPVALLRNAGRPRMKRVAWCHLS
jgi:hypothetical protein